MKSLSELKQNSTLKYVKLFNQNTVVANEKRPQQSPNKTPVIAREVRPWQSVGLDVRVMRLPRRFAPRNDETLGGVL